jgi:tRNA1(Val) A37 N6-methylase TrmN6
LLLAACVPAAAGDHVVDFGAGVGAAGLAVATRVAGIGLTLCERDARLVELAHENIRANGFADHARAVTLDVAGPVDAFVAQGLMPDSVAHVLMNPPFNDATRHRASPDESRRVAHEAGDGLIAGWVHAARRILKPRGTLSLIGRPEGLAETLASLARGFGAVKVLPVHPRPDRAAIRVLVRAEKGARGALALLPGFVLAGSAGQPTPECDAVLRAAGALALLAEV